VKNDGKSELEGSPTTDIPFTKLEVSAMLKVIEPLTPAPGVNVVSIAFLTKAVGGVEVVPVLETGSEKTELIPGKAWSESAKCEKSRRPGLT
jgi:hypothetical protein